MNRDGTTDGFDRDAERAEDAARRNDEAVRWLLSFDLPAEERAKFDRLTGKAGETAAEDLANAEQILALLGPGTPAPEEYNVGGAVDRARRLIASAREKMAERDRADRETAERLADWEVQI